MEIITAHTSGNCFEDDINSVGKMLGTGPSILNKQQLLIVGKVIKLIY